ncbi:hypothetical protein ACH4TV_31535 [Streptomyces sp. NPDC020898]
MPDLRVRGPCPGPRLSAEDIGHALAAGGEDYAILRAQDQSATVKAR